MLVLELPRLALYYYDHDPLAHCTQTKKSINVFFIIAASASVRRYATSRRQARAQRHLPRGGAP